MTAEKKAEETLKEMMNVAQEVSRQARDFGLGFPILYWLGFFIVAYFILYFIYAYLGPALFGGRPGYGYWRNAKAVTPQYQYIARSSVYPHPDSAEGMRLSQQVNNAQSMVDKQHMQ